MACRSPTCATEHHILPTQFYQWQKQLFENGATAFERKGKAARPFAEERRIQQLRSQAGHQERGDRRADGGERQLKKTRWGALKGQWVATTCGMKWSITSASGAERTELSAKQWCGGSESA